MMVRLALVIFCAVLAGGAVYGQPDDALNADNVAALAPVLVLGRGAAYDVAVPFGLSSRNNLMASGQYAVASGRGLWLFYGYMGNEILFETPVALTAAAINGEGDVLIAGDDDGSLRVYGYEHQTDATLPPTQIDAHLYRVTDIAFSDDGRHVATADLSGVVRVWQTNGGQLVEVSTAQYANPVSALEFLNQSGGLVVRSDGRDAQALILQSLNGELIPTLSEFYPSVVALTVDERNQVTALYADEYQRVWNIATPTMTILPTRYLGGLRVEDANGSETVNEVHAVSGEITAVGGTDGLIRLYRGDAGEPYATLYLHTRTVSALAFSADGTLLFSAGLDRSIKVWDVAGVGELAPIMSLEDAHNGGITALAVTHDGAYLVSGGFDGVIKVWGVAAD